MERRRENEIMIRRSLLALTMCCAGLLGAAVPPDAVLSDFPRLAGETDDAPRFRRAIAAAPNGVLAVGKGEYSIATPLVITNRCSLEMHPAAHLVAVREMDFVLTWDGHDNYHALSVFNPDGSVYDNAGLFIRGGDIDGRGLASCLRIGNGHHFTLSNITLHNGRKAGLELSRWNGGHLYELVANNVYCKCTMPGLAGNVGVDLEVCDCHLTDVIVVDYTVGIRARESANRFTRCHVWGGTVPPKGMSMRAWSDIIGDVKRRKRERRWTSADETRHLAYGVPEMLVGSVAFDAVGGSNVFDGCYADTAEIGFRLQRGGVIVNSGFFNNPIMNLRKSTAIVHAGGPLTVSNGDFRGAAKCELLYEGTGKDVTWRDCQASGGVRMADELKALSGTK